MHAALVLDHHATAMHVAVVFDRSAAKMLQFLFLDERAGAVHAIIVFDECSAIMLLFEE